MRIVRPGLAAAALVAFPLLTGMQATSKPEDDFAGLVKAYLALSHPADWEGIEQLPGIKWAPLPATSLKNCLANGDCFARQGSGSIGGRTMTVVATGARTMVMHLLIRNTSAPLGEPAVVAALGTTGLATELVRCPVKSGAGGTNWYRVKGAAGAAGHLSIQPASARAGEGFILSAGDELPALPPNQLASYTESCAPGATRKPVSTSKPHELVAENVVALLVPASGAALYDWKTLMSLPTGVEWNGTEPKKWDLTSRGDHNPVALSGAVAYAGRKFSVLASGTPAQVKTVYLEEQARHPSGEHMLGVVYEKGVAVKLVRCGPVYTESTNNWYGLTSTKTRPAMIRQSISYDGKQAADTYELRLDGSLPARDPRDRNPGTNGC